MASPLGAGVAQLRSTAPIDTILRSIVDQAVEQIEARVGTETHVSNTERAALVTAMIAAFTRLQTPTVHVAAPPAPDVHIEPSLDTGELVGVLRDVLRVNTAILAELQKPITTDVRRGSDQLISQTVQRRT